MHVATVIFSVSNKAKTVTQLFSVAYLQDRKISRLSFFNKHSSNRIINRQEFLFLSVLQLFRHGDRSPTETFPADPYDESAWLNGYGQLTTVISCI